MFQKAYLFVILAIITLQGSAKILPSVTRITQRGGNVVQVLEPSDMFHNLELCNIKLPNGTVYQLYPESNVTNSKINFADVTPNSKKCAVSINNINLNDLGTWELQEIDNYTFFIDTEKKLNFLPLIIKIEERSETLPNGSISVMEGHDVHIKFLGYMESPKTCGLKLPSNSKSVQKKTSIYSNSDCGVTITNISSDLSGVWSMNATKNFTLYSFINITVKAPPTVNTEKWLSYGTKVTLVFGPDESIFCQVTDPKGKKFPSQIGQCTVQVPKVNRYHDGIWIAKVGIQGSTNTIDYTYNVNVVENLFNIEPPNDKTVIPEISLMYDKSLLIMTCSLIVTTVHSCRMIRSDGHIFMLEEGISEGRYSYFGNSLTTDLNNNTIFQCGIQIDHPTEEDLTNWECMIVHSDDNIETGGLLNVVQEVIVIGGNVTAGNITSLHKNIETINDNSFEMLCFAPSHINYCWFRSPNGTHYLSLTPDSSTSEGFEYFGRGFTFGECGIRVKYARKSDTGRWSCNMGGTNQMDFRKTIDVQVHDKTLQAYQKSIYINRGIQIGCRTYDNSSVEYCRFVRPDGQGINPSRNRVTAYTDGDTDLKYGKCMLRIFEPSYADIGTWLCAGKAPTEENEYYDFIYVHNNGWYNNAYYSSAYVWTIVIVLFLTMATVVILSRHTKMAEKVKTQTVWLRESFTRKKKPSESQI